MAKNANQAQLTDGSVEAYLADIADEDRRHDCEALAALLATLGKHKATKACVSIKRLADVDTAVLRKVVAGFVAEVKRRRG